MRHGVVRSSPVNWVAYVIMPLFALANAGVSLDGVNLANEGRNPLEGPIRLGVIHTIGPYLLPQLAAGAGDARNGAGSAGGESDMGAYCP